jgi:hypothetical protein
MKFQPRDSDMLQAIQKNEGILARRQLKALFWPDKSWRAMEQRLAKLFQAGYICWPGKEQYKTNPIPEAICWLGWRGALFIAGEMGIEVDPPKGDNEYQLRILENKLHKKGFHWVREPRWSLLEHDLAIIDFRMAIETAIKDDSSLSLVKWISENEFRSYNDTVTIEIKKIKRQDIPIQKKVFPDGYVEIVNETLEKIGQPSRMRFLLEFDMGTHDTQRFGREKVLPGVEYIQSPIYKSRFGSNSGYWLIIAKGGSTRIKNLLFQVKKNAGLNARLFFFASLNELQGKNPLTSPIWLQANKTEPRSLL